MDGAVQFRRPSRVIADALEGHGDHPVGEHLGHAEVDDVEFGQQSGVLRHQVVEPERHGGER